jgi:hypothetical protein
MVIRNRVREAGNEGIWAEGQSELMIAHNYCYGNGDSGIEFYQDVPNDSPLDSYFMGGTALTSVGNICVGNYQGGLNYLSNITGYNTAMCSSSGDYAAWTALGGCAFGGDGWSVTGLVCEYNAACAVLAYANRSTFTNIVCRENQYSNYGSFAAIEIAGQGNIISNVRAWQETSRATGYTMAVIGSSTFSGLNNSMMNVDLRDTAGSSSLQLAGNVERFNVRTNGTYDQSVESKAYVALVYSASMTPDLSLGTMFVIVASNTTAFAINAPLNATPGQIFRIMIQNTSGSSLGTITFNSAYHLAGGTAPNPSNGDNITIEFMASQGSTVFWELNRASGNVGN